MFNESLLILQGQLLGTQLLIGALNSLKDLEFFIFVGTLSHSFGPIEDVVSMPYLSVHGMLRYGYIQTEVATRGAL